MIDYIGYPYEYVIAAPMFFGREKELVWMDNHLRARSSSNPVIITGDRGVGKTMLADFWYRKNRWQEDKTLWMDISSSRNPEHDLENILLRLKNREFIYDDRLHIVLDGADIWSSEKIREITGKILNYKAVDALVFIRQQPLDDKRVSQLNLEQIDLSRSTGVGQMIEGTIYSLNKQIVVSKPEIITNVLPIVKATSKKIITELQKRPEDIYQVSPRTFEEILAELLTDMGYDIELTKQTRDGGADILAYKKTPIGRLLFLVEAKQYRQDRKVGIDLVKQLHSTLIDRKANSAMMVTTSSFTKDAKEFQKKYEYLLSLKEYEDVVSWILKYGKVPFV